MKQEKQFIKIFSGIGHSQDQPSNLKHEPGGWMPTLSILTAVTSSTSVNPRQSQL